MSDKSTIADIIEDHLHLEGPLLPILHAIQSRFGYLPADTRRWVAQALRISEADVHGVISFYHFFREQPPGKHVVSICRAEACQAQGCRALEAHIKQTLGIDFHQTTADRQITLEPVYCLGNCATGPSLRVDDRIIGRVSKETFDQLAATLSTDVVKVVA